MAKILHKIPCFDVMLEPCWLLWAPRSVTHGRIVKNIIGAPAHTDAVYKLPYASKHYHEEVRAWWIDLEAGKNLKGVYCPSCGRSEPCDRWDSLLLNASDFCLRDDGYEDWGGLLPSVSDRSGPRMSPTQAREFLGIRPEDLPPQVVLQAQFKIHGGFQEDDVRSHRAVQARNVLLDLIRQTPRKSYRMGGI